MLDCYFEVTNSLIENAILEDIKTKKDKKSMFQSSNLKNYIVEISNNYIYIEIEINGNYLIENQSLGYSYATMLDPYSEENVEQNKELETLLTISLFSEESLITLYCTSDDKTCVVYGICLKNKMWNSVPCDKLRELLSEEILEFNEYENYIFDEIKKKY